ACDGPRERVGIRVEPLVPAGDVRRRVGAGGETLRTQQRRDRAGRRRLAVRPDDVDRRERALRATEALEQRAHSSEPELLRPRRQRRDPGNVVHAREFAALTTGPAANRFGLGTKLAQSRLSFATTISSGWWD